MAAGDSSAAANADRRTQRATQATTAWAPDGAEPVEAAQQLPLSTVRRLLRQAFMIAAAVGGALVFVMPLMEVPIVWPAVLGPAVLVVYYGICRRWAQTPTAHEVLADSVYYLGFLMTFAALLGALGPFRRDAGTLESGDVVANVGMALTTTVVGMFIRLVVTHFAQIGTSADEEAQDQLNVQVARFAEDLDRSVAEARELRARLVNDIREQTEHLGPDLGDRLQQRVDEAGQAISDQGARVGASLAELAARLDAVTVDGDAVTKRVEAALAPVQQQVGQLASGVETAAQQLHRLPDVCNRVEQSARSCADTLEQVGGASRSLEGLATSVERLDGSVDALVRHVRRLDERLDGAVTRAELDVQAKVTELNQDTDTVKQAMASLSAELSDLRTETRTIGSQVATASHELVAFLRQEIDAR